MYSKIPNEIIEYMRFSDSTKETIKIIAITSIVISSVVVPGAAAIIRILEKRQRYRNYDQKCRSLRHLLRKGYVSILDNGNDRYKITLTQKGDRKSVV